MKTGKLDESCGELRECNGRIGLWLMKGGDLAVCIV